MWFLTDSKAAASRASSVSNPTVLFDVSSKPFDSCCSEYLLLVRVTTFEKVGITSPSKSLLLITTSSMNLTIISVLVALDLTPVRNGSRRSERITLSSVSIESDSCFMSLFLPEEVTTSLPRLVSSSGFPPRSSTLAAVISMF